MVEINVVYDGELSTTATHGPSKKGLTTDAPVDNQGRGESFSPTDLLATSLATCMLTVMGIAAKREGIVLDGTLAHVVKHMTSQPPRKVARLDVTVTIPRERAALIAAQQRAMLEEKGETCPVRLSIHPEVDVRTEYVWG